MPEEQRKLAAIMFTDIVGYSRMMSRDEKKTLEILEKNREIHRSTIEKHNGEFIKEIGDGTLSIFNTSSDAVNCALTIQEICSKQTDFSIRIGIHIGEIVIIDKDVFGDGVNIASRIEASGKSEGIFISGRVYEDIRNKTGIKAIFQGEKKLKNISHPVKIYRLQQVDADISANKIQQSGKIKNPLKKTRAVFAAFITLIALLIISIIYITILQKTPGFDERLIAVATFENHTGDVSLDPVGKMASDWITQGISGTGLVSVIPSLKLKASGDIHQNMDGIRHMAEESNAQTIITGVYYKHGDKLQFYAHLVDAGENEILNAIGPVTGPVNEPLQAIEILRQKVLGALAANFDREFENFSDRILNPPSYEAYLKFLAGVDIFWNNNYDDAIERFVSAYNLDTSYFLPLMLAYSSYINAADFRKADSISEIIKRHTNDLTTGERLIHEYLDAIIDGDLEMSYKKCKLSGKYFLPHRYNSAYDAIKANYPGQAIEILQGLDPDYEMFPNWYPEVLAMAYHMKGDYKRELEIAHQARKLNPELYSAYWNELKALAALGKIDEINNLLDESLDLPKIEKQSWAPGYPGWLMIITAQELRAHGYPEAAEDMIQRSVTWFLDHPLIEDKSYLASAYYFAGQMEKSRALYEMLFGEDPENIEYLGYLGVIAARMGNEKEADKISKSLDETDKPYLKGLNLFWRARIAAILDQKEKAVDLLRDAFARGFHIWYYDIPYYEIMDLENLHGYQPYKDLIKPK